MGVQTAITVQLIRLVAEHAAEHSGAVLRGCLSRNI